MKNTSKALLVCSAVLLATTQARASGYQLNEYSATGLGRAFAGSGVVGDDYSAIAFNPAGMVLKNSGGQMGITAVQMHSIVTGKLIDNGTGTELSSSNTKPKGRMDLYKYLPHFFAQHRVNDKTVIGMGVYTPFGLASEYNADWFANSHGIKTELEVIDVAAGGAYQLNDQWSLGATLIYRYVHGDIINSLALPTSPATLLPNSRNRMDLDGWEWAYNVGIMYEPVKDTRFGAAYRYNPAQTVKGKHTISNALPSLNGVYNGRSQMTLPSTLTLSAFHKLNDKIGLSAGARWAKWNVFDNFVMTSDMPTTSYIPERWKNVWTYSLGMDYYYSDAITLRTGLSYDPTPIKSARYRTARIPDSDRFWVTTGFSYKHQNMQFDAGYSHLFMKTGDTNNSDASTTLKSKHENYSNMFGLQMQYNF